VIRLKFSLSTLIGENCITPDQGKLVYAKIYPELKEGRLVELDFAGVRIFASPFFNEAIGRLLSDIAGDSLNRSLNIQNLSAAGLDVLRHVIENSKQYYSSGETKTALDRILAEHDQK
jgi:hypothetical protein